MKTILFIIGIFFCSNVSGQKVYEFDKIGILGSKTKFEGTITITDSTLSLFSIIKGKEYIYIFKIVTKDENEVAPTYNCVGQVGVSDKHQFSFVLSKNMVFWNSYNSNDNSKIEQILYFKK